MNINDIYKIVSYLVDKYQGTYLSPDEFNSVINMAQRQFLNYMTEDGSGHMGMRLGRKSGTLVNAPIAESLSRFLVDDTISGSGSFTQPDNLYSIVSVRTSDDQNVIRKITYNKLAEVLGDPIDPPTETDPVYLDKTNQLIVYPDTITDIKLSYIREPNNMYWSHDGNLNYSETGAQLLTTGTGAAWSGNFTSGYTHTAGTASTLVSDVYAKSKTKYTISATVTGRTAGIATLIFGDFAYVFSSNTSYTGTFTNTNQENKFSISPTSLFDGTISVEIKAPSVDPEWNLKDIEDIIYRAIGIIGINLKDGDLQRAAQMVKTQGE
jgi:hypothetical protein